MTTTTDTTATTCPAWCTSECGKHDTGGHDSGHRAIRLSHAEPERFDHPMDGEPAWTAPEVDVSLWQRHGATWPSIVVDGPKGFLTLDVVEAQELAYALLDLIEKGTGRNVTPGLPGAT